MAINIDPAILEALSLDAASTTYIPHGVDGLQPGYKLTSRESDGTEKVYFVKQGSKKCADIFAGEHASLNAIHDVDPTLCPQSFAHGRLSLSPGSFHVLEFLNLEPSSSSKTGSGVSLAHKLAKLHSTPANTGPNFHNFPVFGFSIPTWCGMMPQDNTYRKSWADFYAECRLGHVADFVEHQFGRDPCLSKLISKTASQVVPRLLRDGHLKSPDGTPISPVVVHGNLSNGNHGKGNIGTSDVEELVFNSSACWAYSEFEFGIMGMFGGFGEKFNEEYWSIKGKDEPVAEWEDRRRLYELYHDLNHYARYGGDSYKTDAERIMRILINKFGDGSLDVLGNVI